MAKCMLAFCFILLFFIIIIIIIIHFDTVKIFHAERLKHDSFEKRSVLCLLSKLMFGTMQMR